ncbi:hypothetical protein KZ483_07320 [Paenibacillus sp. sptzw28]|nr:hypothetical protein KZ483_07320 [Paenibacillus sp. sptzw28]
MGACAEGIETTASGVGAHAEGYRTIASFNTAHAEGSTTTSSGSASHSEGYLTNASADTAHAEGYGTTASGAGSHAEGYLTTSSGTTSHAEGSLTTASGLNAHAEGQGNTASGNASHAEGGGLDQLDQSAPNLASGPSSHAEGVGTIASGFGAHAEGGINNISFSSGPVASGDFSHAEGFGGTTASGIGSHAEGFLSVASEFASHAEGYITDSSGFGSHSEGQFTVSSGPASHAEGTNTRSTGVGSHSEGSLTVADASYSHAGGLNTNTGGLEGAFIIGQNAIAAYPYSFHLGNGLVDGPTLNASILDNAGNLRLDGSLISSGAADFAEMFETSDANPIEPGYFVTFDGESDKIRKATAADDYILGIVSANPAVIADASDLRWHKLFLTDEWGRTQYHEVSVPVKAVGGGNVISPSSTKREPILNPEYDPSNTYVSRLLRPEWVSVGLLGKLLVHDDGSCKIGKYAKSNNEGIATDSNEGYRVMKRTGPNQILVLVK